MKKPHQENEESERGDHPDQADQRMELSKHKLLAVHPENSQRANSKDIDHDRNGKSGGDQEETEPPAV